jgi:Trk-type K+ transport system membrane component
MIRGRHRGLPYKLDRAIVLPSDRLEDHQGRDEVQTKVD